LFVHWKSSPKKGGRAGISKYPQKEKKQKFSTSKQTEKASLALTEIIIFSHKEIILRFNKGD
jgi:transposase